jgi:hypothetical protein
MFRFARRGGREDEITRSEFAEVLLRAPTQAPLEFVTDFVERLVCFNDMVTFVGSPGEGMWHS